MVMEREISKYYYHSENDKVVKYVKGGGLLGLIATTTESLNNELYKDYEYRTVFNEAEVYLAKNIVVKGLEMLIYCTDNSLYSIITMFDGLGKYVLEDIDNEELQKHYSNTGVTTCNSTLDVTTGRRVTKHNLLDNGRD